MKPAAWKPDVIVYHHPCPDGFTAYWILHHYFVGVDFLPMPANYGQPFDFEACRGKRVLFADFSLPKDDLMKLAFEYNANVVILDHHESAQKALESFSVPLNVRPEERVGDPSLGGTVAAWFDMNRSGATMTWDWCYPGVPRPLILGFVEARDLWQPERMASLSDMVMPVSAYLRMHEKTIANWDRIEQEIEHQFFGLVVPKAKAIWQYHMALVNDMVPKAQFENIGGFDVPVVNCIYELSSDVSSALLKRYPDAPFVGTYSVRRDDNTGKFTRFWGLRSEASRENVSEIAVKLGGGGHRNASGFRETLGG